MENCITKKELEQLIEKEVQFQLIDVRTKDEFDASHIPFAINIPIDELNEKLNQIDSDKVIVVTCGIGGGRSQKAFEILKDAQFNSRYLDKGTVGWFEK